MSKKARTREAQNNIAAARKAFEKRTGQKYTQNDAANDFGISLSTYRNYEQEHTLPNGGVAAIMASKYGVSVDYLMGRAGVSYSVMTLDELTDDEKELIRLYRILPTKSKKALLAGLREYGN